MAQTPLLALLVGFSDSPNRPLGRYSDRGAVKPVAGFGTRGRENAQSWKGSQAARI